MKLLGDQKGQIRIIEAFFASILILSTVALIPSPPPTEDVDSKILNLKAQDVLAALETDGALSNLIANRNWTTLGKRIESLLSPAVWFNLTVFDENMQMLNEIPICSGSPISEKISVAELVYASPGRDYRVYLIRLQLSSVT